LFAAYYDEPDDVGRLLDLVDLRAVARTPWRHLSGGEQQRLSLALALVGRPEVVFLDEPTAGVDPEGRLQVRAVIAELRRQGVCILLTTHELPEAEHLADRVVIIRRGRAVATGSPDELVAGLSAPDVDGGAPGGRARRGITFGSRPGLDTDALAHTLGVPVVEERPGRYRIDAASNPALTASLATFLARHDADLADLHTGRTLEEAYLEIVGGPERGAEGGGHGGDRGDGGGGGDPGPRGAGRRRRRP
jgi:ABC-2 type transport system ATP-binding protein